MCETRDKILMMLQTPSRRGVITGLISLVAAPAIARISSLMLVRVMEPLIPVDAGHFVIMAPEQYADLLKNRIDAAYELMHRALLENTRRQLYETGTGSDPLNGLFE